MALSDNSKFGINALTAAINRMDATATQIRDLAIFEAKNLTTTYADIENQDGQLKLVQSQPRGTDGQAQPNKSRTVRTFRIPHLPISDVVRADDVQNLRGFDGTAAETVENVVNSRLADAKLALEHTREHLMLGALQGKILDADGSELYDLYDEFGLTRQTFNWKLSDAKTEVGAAIDKALTAQRKKLRGAMPSKWVVLCGSEFLEALKYHASIKALYERYRDGAAYREADSLNPIVFEHNGVQFIQYTGAFGTSADIADDKAILLPVGRKLYAEFFAPADMNATVNTVAKPYYASREKLDHDKGWSLHAQSNPLPIVLRPELVATLSLS